MCNYNSGSGYMEPHHIGIHFNHKKKYFSVAKATLQSLMSSEGVVILNLGCGYIENGVVISVR